MSLKNHAFATRKSYLRGVRRSGIKKRVSSHTLRHTFAVHYLIETGKLPLPQDFPVGSAYKKWKDDLYAKNWVVYTKKPFSSVKKVVNYLGRYAHRVALTNHRIKNIADGQVTFQYKDYKDGSKKKLMVLSGEEFLRRFCLHILPRGFRKIRQYGFLSNATKAQKLALAQVALGQKTRQLLDRKTRKKRA